MSARALYLTFYILYLIAVLTSLWFLLYYTAVPSWIWGLFATSIVIAIVLPIIREYSSINTNYDSYKSWVIFYLAIYIIILGLFIAGLSFTIMYSNILWWIWVIFGIGIMLSIVADAILNFSPGFAAILVIIAIVLFITGLIFLIMYSDAPWWLWIIIGIAIISGIISAIFAGITVNERSSIIIPQSRVNSNIITERCL